MFYGEDGLLAGLSPGKIWIDHSTTDHEQNKARIDRSQVYTDIMAQIFTDEVRKKGAELLECPITGGLEALKKGTVIENVSKFYCKF